MLINNLNSENSISQLRSLSKLQRIHKNSEKRVLFGGFKIQAEQ